MLNVCEDNHYFINMGGEYPDNAFTAVIFKSDTSKFHDVESLEGKMIAISGKVKEYRSEQGIVAEKKHQLR